MGNSPKFISIVVLFAFVMTAKSEGVQGGQTYNAVQERNKTYEFSNTSEASITATTHNTEWLFDNAKIDNAESWTSPGNVKGLSTASTTYSTTTTPMTFAVIMDGNLLPPAGSGSGSTYFKVSAILKGELYISPKTLVCWSEDKRIEKFTAKLDDLSQNVLWFLENDIVQSNKSELEISYETIVPSLVGYQVGEINKIKPGKYTVKCEFGDLPSPTAELLLSELRIQQKTSSSSYNDIADRANLEITSGDATNQPEYPELYLYYTGWYKDVKFTLQHGASLSQSRNIICYRYEKTSGRLTEGVAKRVKILSGNVGNGGLIRTINNQSMGGIVKYTTGNDTTVERKIGIKGKNPTKSNVFGFIDNKASLLTFSYDQKQINFVDYYKRIITHESSCQQFITSGAPKYGAPNGWGIAQIDLGSRTDYQSSEQAKRMWNWHVNLTEGIGTIAQKVSEVTSLVNSIRRYYPNLPPLTSEQFIQALVISYNGFGGTYTININTPSGQMITKRFCFRPNADYTAWSELKDNTNSYWGLIDGITI